MSKEEFKEKMSKEEFKEKLEELIREYDWSYEDTCTIFSNDERQHAMYDITISIRRYFRLPE